jgi:hypothetical protein
MRSRFVLLGGLLNLTTLAVGVVLGFLLGIQHFSSVSAQVKPTVVPITPGITTGQFGAGLILAHEIQSDKIIANGYDLVKMNEKILNYLLVRAPFDKTALQSIVDDSRAETLYTIKSSTPQSQPEKKP